MKIYQAPQFSPSRGCPKTEKAFLNFSSVVNLDKPASVRST